MITGATMGGDVFYAEDGRHIWSNRQPLAISLSLGRGRRAEGEWHRPPSPPPTLKFRWPKKATAVEGGGRRAEQRAL